VGGAHAAPSSMDGEEELWRVGEEVLLGLGREHQVAVALGDHGERGEDAATDAEVDGTHVGALFGAGKLEGEALEVGWGHGALK